MPLSELQKKLREKREGLASRRQRKPVRGDTGTTAKEEKKTREIIQKQGVAGLVRHLGIGDDKEMVQMVRQMIETGRVTDMSALIAKVGDIQAQRFASEVAETKRMAAEDTVPDHIRDLPAAQLLGLPSANPRRATLQYPPPTPADNKSE